jgi:hypothetical protein
MKTEVQQKRFRIHFGSVFTGMVVGFLGAAVLYQKQFPGWVPQIFHGNPLLFFSVFVVICGVLGHLWTVTD